jgi:hypothetical protein
MSSQSGDVALGLIQSLSKRVQALEGRGSKTFLICFDLDQVSEQTMMDLGAQLKERGYASLCIGVYEPSEPILVFDLANLPPAEMEEIRAMCAKAAA